MEVGQRRRFPLKNLAWRLTGWLVVLLAAAFTVAASAEPVPDTCKIHYPSDAAVPWTCYRIRPHDTLPHLFGAEWEDVLRFNRIDRRHIYPGVRLKVPDDLRQVDDFSPMPKTYPSALRDPKFILVNLAEQFLGAYAYGKLAMSFPITSGMNAIPARRTPDGLFRVSAYDRLHTSSLYDLADSSKPYPMHYALRFFITPQWVAVWIHGRDVPGYAASHGCIGLYDEQMQKEYYGYPRHPLLEDARALYEWVIAGHPDDGHFHDLAGGPPVQIVGQAPDFPPHRIKGARKLPAPQTKGLRPAGVGVVR
ncbi:MAG: L,D-transpeptidase family protein [Betaproteobacteria bacterium]|nr:L,D-transpeptidase family protein [Betaproteobacteria bacterium]